jgi:hypothetical protein
LTDALRCAHDALGGLAAAELDDAERGALAAEITDLARAAGDAIAALDGGAPATRMLAGELADVYRILANNAADDAPVAGLLLDRARWRWQAEGDATDDLVNAFRAAWEAARAEGDAEAERAAGAWFRARGLPLPGADLEGDGDGG